MLATEAGLGAMAAREAWHPAPARTGQLGLGEKKDKNPPRPKDENNEKGVGPNRLEIEVLGNDPVRKLGGEGAVDGLRYYRVREGDGTNC